ncbi:MAG: hypothetical protein DID89_2727548264 [Candidatus Nitrotoga sp. CP45]|nr:MAG: hypothetical protein DID89_2727548264 [Candidatus Nitrotoga sp. CP45]
MKPNIAVKRDWLTAGFARLQPAPYLKRVCRAWHVTMAELELGSDSI